LLLPPLAMVRERDRQRETERETETETDRQTKREIVISFATSKSKHANKTQDDNYNQNCTSLARTHIAQTKQRISLSPISIL
jgi:hypothetical protein